VQGIEKDTLAVGPGAVQEEQHMLGRHAGHAIARHALQVGLQLLILGGDAIEKLGPQRDRHPFVGGDCSNFGVVVFTAVRAVLPRSQVEGHAPSFLPLG
jgi:hypothetical protein